MIPVSTLKTECLTRAPTAAMSSRSQHSKVAPMSETRVATNSTKRDMPWIGWQNWFHSERDVVFANGESNPAGEWCSPNIYVSQAEAEEAAETDMIAFAGWVRENGIRWLGARYVEEMP